MEEVHQLIKDSAIKKLQELFKELSGINDSSFKRLSKHFIFRQFDRKSLLVSPGEIDEYFNFIVKGVVRKYIISGKKEITLQLSTEGHFIHSELSFHTLTPSLCYVEAIESCIFLSIRHDDLNRLYDEVPELNRLARIITGVMYVRKEKRDLEQLRLDTRERFMRYVEKNPEMLQRVPQKYIASYLNIKPETFSRLKHLLKAKK